MRKTYRILAWIVAAEVVVQAIAIAWFVGGPLGGWLYQTFAKQQTNPNTVWYSLFGIGVAATVLMSLYNYVVGRSEN